jgi:glycosyltransferase involved in cell wall biosynthesis
MISVVIPSRGERFMPHTIDDILKKATTDIEIIAVLDGYWPERYNDDPRVTYIHHGESRGMRACLNHAVSISKGEWIMKTDAHCMFADGFDEVLLRDIEENWVVIPRRLRLDAENWCLIEVDRMPIDYHWVTCPFNYDQGFHLEGKIWPKRSGERRDILIDDTPIYQGSFWMTSRKQWDFLGGMPELGYGRFTQEPIQIGLATWLSGGRVVTNKNTWYAHLHKGVQYGRGYPYERPKILLGQEWSARYWMNNHGPKQTRPIEWWIEKFLPMPGWEPNWQDLWRNHEFNEKRSAL